MRLRVQARVGAPPHSRTFNVLPLSVSLCLLLCRTSKALALTEVPDLTEEHIAFAAAGSLTGRFTGNPGKKLGPDADEPEEEEEEPPAEGEEGAEGGADAAPRKPKKVKFSEAHRLHFVVKSIDRECGVVPRGSFAVTPTHRIVRNRAFAGISATEAAALASYVHFRPAEGAARKDLLARAAVVGAGDFLDPIAEDEPAGVWSVLLQAGRGAVQLRSARWPGYFFWHAFGSPRFGSVYQGDGLPNVDLSFSF